MDKTRNPMDWKFLKIEDVSKSITTGGTPKRSFKEYWENGNIPWLKISDLKSTYINNSEEKITAEGLNNSSTKLFPVGTVLYSIFATIGAIGILNFEASSNQAIAGILPNNEIIDTKYLYHCLIHEKKRIVAKKSRATQDNINLKILRSHEIPVPPLETQKKIVEILEKAEKLKEWRAEANELTDAYLKSVFIEMFGDHRKNDRNFETKSFLDVFDLTTGKLNSNASVENGKYPFFTCSKETFKIDDYSFDCEALLLSGNNAAGEYSVKHYNGKFDAYQRTYVLSLKDKNNSYQFYRTLLEEKLKELKYKSIGTNTKYLTMSILKRINLIEPNYEIQNQFAQIVQQVETLKTHQSQSKQEIDNLFNTLMQKAFKGELVC